jgi:hypothetical protein
MTDGIQGGDVSSAEQRAEDEVAYWLKVARESWVEGITHLEDAAKQCVVIASFLQGVYFAAVSFSDIKKVGSVNDCWFILFVALSLLVIALWMGCIFLAARVFTPHTHQTSVVDNGVVADQAMAVRDTYDKILRHKHRNLTGAYVLLWLSFLPLATNLVVYLVLLPNPPACP